MSKRLGFFFAGAAAIWAAGFALAGLLWADQWQSILICSLAALGLCLVPTLITLLWSHWGLKQSPDMQLIAVLGGTGVRMFFVLGVGLLLSTAVPYLRQHQLNFWLWVLIFYLVTLALEMILIVQAQGGTAKTGESGSTTSLPS